ncbi:MAG: triose-phosphate isomerase [Alphaproteobacteria bacterium]
MKKLIAGNWKMNGQTKENAQLIADITRQVNSEPALLDLCDILICPPSVYIPLALDATQKDEHIQVGAQDSSAHNSGAYTGEVSPSMLRDIGCSYVILGHSERRQYHNESDSLIRQKAALAHDAGLIAIICVGETETQRDAGQEENIVGTQILASLPESATAANTVIAYEPVWAIGTGKTANVQDVTKMHSFIRNKLKERLADSENMRILYGGSMKPENAQELLAAANVDGGLIGGASLKADQFVAIARAAR